MGIKKITMGLVCLGLILFSSFAPAGAGQDHIRFSLAPVLYHHEYTEPGIMENQYTTTGNWAYLRKSNYIYSPIGLMVAVPMESGWTLRPFVEYDLFWAGTQKSYLGYQPGYESVENDQNGGYGLRAALGLERQMSRYTLGIQLFYRYWDIDRSDIFRDRWGRRWVEPENETREIGAGVLFQF